MNPNSAPSGNRADKISIGFPFSLIFSLAAEIRATCAPGLGGGGGNGAVVNRAIKSTPPFRELPSRAAGVYFEPKLLRLACPIAYSRSGWLPLRPGAHFGAGVNRSLS